MITQEEYTKALNTIKDYKLQLEKEIKEINRELKAVSKFINVTKDTKVWDVNCTVRLRKFLKDEFNLNGIETCVSDLSVISKTKFLEVKNKHTIELFKELFEICYYANVQLQP